MNGGAHIRGFGGEKMKERGFLEGPSVDGRIILKSNLKDREFDSCCEGKGQQASCCDHRNAALRDYPDELKKAQFPGERCAMQQPLGGSQLCAGVTDSCLTRGSTSAAISVKLTRNAEKKCL